MRSATETNFQLVSLFCGNYVAEQHHDHTRTYLPCLNERPLTADFDRVLQALRSALSLRPRAA